MIVVRDQRFGAQFQIFLETGIVRHCGGLAELSRRRRKFRCEDFAIGFRRKAAVLVPPDEGVQTAQHVRLVS